MPDARVKVGALLSDRASGGWRDFCDSHRVSFTALLEVLGRRMADDPRKAMAMTGQQLDALLDEARDLDYSRLQRGRRPPES
ncbi:MAG TPA: hypothetical protein VD926_00845 [Acidimicrobiales bacterium]|nr:hypothetical protein [Acidimicrobiales bacterium]